MVPVDSGVKADMKKKSLWSVSQDSASDKKIINLKIMDTEETKQEPPVVE